MQAERAGKHAVTEADLRHIVGGGAAHHRDAGNAFRPSVEVLFGIADDGGFARGARGSVHAHEILFRYGKQAERIIVAQVFLGGEGKLGEVRQGLDILRLHARRIHLFAVRKNFFIDPIYGLLQSFELDLFDLASG